MTHSGLPFWSPSGGETQRRVLVVEDNDTTRRRLREILRRDGYQVHEAIDGLDALKKVSTARYDAIVLDLVMPNVDGWQFRQTVLRHPELAPIPTIVVTVQPLREQDRYALRTPFVLHKPFEDEAVLAAVQQACRMPRAEEPEKPARSDVEHGLFWSRRGEVACALHAPSAETERWRDERWSAIPRGAGKNRVTYQCQHCAGGVPILRTPRPRS